MALLFLRNKKTNMWNLENMETDVRGEERIPRMVLKNYKVGEEQFQNISQVMTAGSHMLRLEHKVQGLQEGHLQGKEDDLKEQPNVF